jgi:hypothetical protein
MPCFPARGSVSLQDRNRAGMRVVIKGMPYETMVIHEAHDVHTTVLIPANTDKTLAELAQEGKIYLLPQDLLQKKEEKQYA